MGDYRLKLTPSAAVWNEAGGYLDIVASVEEPDRDDEVVVPRTLRLDNYQKNPVVIWAHQQDAHPIARCESPDGAFTCRVDEAGRLRQRWYFGTTPEARQAAELYRDKILRGASIGFVSDGLEDVPAAEAERLYGVRKRLRRHTGGELVETSAVPVPSCPGALALAWVDAPRAAEVVRRGGLPGLVTKALSSFPGLAGRAPQARAGRKMGRTRPTPGAKPVSTTAATDVTPTDTAVAVTAKDMATTDDTGGGSAVEAPEPREQVKAAIEGAMHDTLARHHAGEMDWEACKAEMDPMAEDHARYGGEGEPDADDEKPTEKDDEGDDEEMKAISDVVTKAVAAAVAPLAAKLSAVEAKVADLPDAEELAEAIATR